MNTKPTPPTQPSLPEVNPQQFMTALGAAAKNIAAFIIALGIIWGATWYAVQPRIDAYFDDKLSSVALQLDKLNAALEDMRARLPKGAKPFIEVKDGIGLIRSGPFQAGSSVGFLYEVRRSLPCATTVKVQFFSANRNGVASELTYLLPSTEIASSFGFSLVSIYVKLPNDMPTGRYSYVPDLLPDRADCPAQRTYSVAPSPFFEVVSQ